MKYGKNISLHGSSLVQGNHPNEQFFCQKSKPGNAKGISQIPILHSISEPSTF